MLESDVVAHAASGSRWIAPLARVTLGSTSGHLRAGGDRRCQLVLTVMPCGRNGDRVTGGWWSLVSQQLQKNLLFSQELDFEVQVDGKS